MRSGTATRYDSLADDYDRWYESAVNQFIDRLEKRSLKLALDDASGDARLLEVGCGTGHWFSLFNAAGYRVVGLDISERMLHITKGKFRSEAGLIRGEAERLPFPDSCFNVVCMMATLHLIADRTQALDEMYRCLKPGGLLLVGALNALSFLGIRRRLFSSRSFREAHFLTAGQLGWHLSRYGRPEIGTCAFLPPYGLLLPLGGIIERVGSALLPEWGQFMVASVKKQ